MKEIDTPNVIDRHEQDKDGSSLSGMGGWLILMLFSIGLSILGMLIVIFSSIGLEKATIVISIYLPFAFMHAFMLTAMVKTLRYFPRMYIIVTLLFVALNVFIDIYTRSIGYMTIAIAILAAIWITYLIKSVRARNTFIHKVVW